MAYWSKGGLAGFDAKPMAFSGKVLGKRHRIWRIYDGVGIRFVPNVHIQSYRNLGKGFVEVTIPSWLWRRRNLYRRVYAGEDKDQ